MGYRWRRMYYLTGIPGWIRFGYSPGWMGRSRTGLSPTAEWITSSGLTPQFTEYLRSGVVQSPFPPYSPDIPLTKDQEIKMLEEQAKAIETQLEATRKRMEAVKKRPATEHVAQPYYPFTPYGPPIHSPLSAPYVEPSPEEELASLEDYMRHIDEEAKGVQARIEELKKLVKEPKEQE